MKKSLVLMFAVLGTLLATGCGSDNSSGIAGAVNSNRCLDLPSANYVGTACGANDSGRYSRYEDNVGGTNTVSCVDSTAVPATTADFETSYVNGRNTALDTYARQGDYIHGDDCASGQVQVTQTSDGSKSTETYIWKKQ